MTVKNFIIAYAVTALLFLAMDTVWLGTMANRLYRPALGSMIADTFEVAPAVLFYLIYIVGVVTFAVMPAIDKSSWLAGLGYGALLGLVAYATYDLTNQAVLKNWSWTVTIADLCWGTFATAVAASLSTRISGWIIGALKS